MAAAKHKAAGEEAAERPLAHAYSRPKRSKGRWTNEEHEGFLAGLAEHGRDWPTLAMLFVPSRTVTQIRTHAQKYFQKTDQGLPFPEEPYSDARIEQTKASSESEPAPLAAGAPGSGCNGNKSGDTVPFHSCWPYPAAQQHEAWHGSPAQGRHRPSTFSDNALARGMELPTTDAWCAAQGTTWSEMGVWDDYIQLMFLTEEAFGLL